MEATTRAAIVVIVGILFIIMGVVLVRNPEWLIKAHLKYLSWFADRSLFSIDSSDKRRTFRITESDKSRKEYHFMQKWIRVTQGYPAILVGILLLAFGILLCLSAR